MNTKTLLRFSILSLSLAACGSSAASLDGGPEEDVVTSDAAAPRDSSMLFGDSAPSGDAGADACNPPDMLVVLDRSDSMKQPPDGADGGMSKWDLAVTAVDLITASPIDSTLRYGLELLPDEALKQGDGGTCGSGLMSIPTGLDNGSAIASTLSTTQLENGTPIGGALALAQTSLADDGDGGRAQDIVLVTDGMETCKALPPLPIVQSLAASNVHTYVVGFGGKADPSELNDLACAGMTATNFPTPCKQTKDGWVANVPDTTHVFYDATDGPALKQTLATIASGLCCGLQHPQLKNVQRRCARTPRFTTLSRANFGSVSGQSVVK